MKNIHSGDTVLHPSMGITRLTVMELLGSKAICGYTNSQNKFAEIELPLSELTKVVDGQTDGKYHG